MNLFLKGKTSLFIGGKLRLVPGDNHVDVPDGELKVQVDRFIKMGVLEEKGKAKAKPEPKEEAPKEEPVKRKRKKKAEDEG